MVAQRRPISVLRWVPASRRIYPTCIAEGHRQFNVRLYRSEVGQFLSVEPAVAVGVELPAERRQRVAHFLNVVQLSKFAKHRPNQLSGGQRQRVAIARALVTQPDIVLADEPTANLDHKTGEGILALMRDIYRRFGTTFIFSTHDRKVIDAADRLIGIEDGSIRYIATRQDGRWHPVRPERARAPERTAP